MQIQVLDSQNIVVQNKKIALPIKNRVRCLGYYNDNPEIIHIFTGNCCGGNYYRYDIKDEPEVRAIGFLSTEIYCLSAVVDWRKKVSFLISGEGCDYVGVSFLDGNFSSHCEIVTDRKDYLKASKIGQGFHDFRFSKNGIFLDTNKSEKVTKPGVSDLGLLAIPDIVFDSSKQDNSMEDSKGAFDLTHILSEKGVDFEKSLQLQSNFVFVKV
jgi:hypothetical protein